MKNVKFSLDQLTPAKKAAPAKVLRAPAAKPTKHGREAVRLLQQLRKFEWDFEAMKRA